MLHSLVIQHGVTTDQPLVQGWIGSEDLAVRRLAVEAFRPRAVMLAHVQELKQDPAPLRALLEPLLDDQADDVRWSASNNISDISENHPEHVVDWARAWLADDESDERRWILSRGLRTLVNAGDSVALGLLGYAAPCRLKINWKDTLPHVVETNELLSREVELANFAPVAAKGILLVGMEAPGKGTDRRQSRYHVWKSTLKGGEARQVRQTIHFADKSSQRTLPGTYVLRATINGSARGEHRMEFLR